jgi:hypothetical protein
LQEATIHLHRFPTIPCEKFTIGSEITSPKFLFNLTFPLQDGMLTGPH